MNFADTIHWIAQGAINLDGDIPVEQGSKVHAAMHNLCKMLSEGTITANDLAQRTTSQEPRTYTVVGYLAEPADHRKSYDEPEPYVKHIGAVSADHAIELATQQEPLLHACCAFVGMLMPEDRNVHVVSAT